MRLDIPDELLAGSNIRHEDAMLDLAIGLFVDQKLSLGRAAKLAGFETPAFLDELGKRKIPVHYDDADLESDIRTMAILKEKRGVWPR